jgi:hypothetical protein
MTAIAAIAEAGAVEGWRPTLFILADNIISCWYYLPEPEVAPVHYMKNSHGRHLPFTPACGEEGETTIFRDKVTCPRCLKALEKELSYALPSADEAKSNSW